MSRPEILDIQPGYLNDFNVDDVDQESIDFQSESTQSVLARMKEKVFTANKFKTSGTLIGILLKTDNRFSGDCTPQDNAIQGATGADAKYKLNTYKVRIPELHFMLPVPDNIGEWSQLSNHDKSVIDMYPTIQAIDTLVQKQGAVPGDLVKVELANKGAITRLYFAGPLDPKTAANNAQAVKDCIDECRKTYSNKGSTGDCIGKNKNVSKLDQVPPLNTGEGIEDKKAHNINSPKWLSNILDKNGDGSGKGSPFDGVTIFGRLNDGANEDDEKMIEGTGRSTVIFIPKGVDPKQSVELVFYFHDKGKFSKDSKEWDHIAKSIFKLTRKNDKLDGARRNIIFVMPEMLWSKQDTSGDNPRVTSQAGVSLTQYGDRQWAQWGFDGKLKNGFSNKKPASFLSSSPKGAGNIKSLVKDVYAKLKEHLGTDVKAKVVWTTLAAEGFGGIAISNLARKNDLGVFKNLRKIKLLHADYSATEQNYYHDNDIKDIVAALVGDTDENKEVEIEFHMSTKGPTLPKNAVAAFIGKTASLTQTWVNNPGAKDTPKNMKEAAKALTSVYKSDLKFQDSEPDFVVNEEAYKTPYDNGLKFIEANKTKTLRLSGFWVNFIFRPVDAKPDIEWISWYDDTGAPTAAAASEVLKAKGEVIVAGTFSKADKDYFSEFKGRVLLYNSNHSAQQGKTAIVVPKGADLTKPYEIIYFFHGLGANVSPHRWRTEGFISTTQEALLNMVTKQKRNVVYVTTQLNVVSKIEGGSKNATFGSGSGKSFSSFHGEVIDRIKEQSLSLGLQGEASPKFINFKSFSGGYYSVEGIVTQMGGPTEFGEPLQRIDYLDSTYSYKTVLTKLLVTLKDNFKPGEQFEIHVYGSTAKTWNSIVKHQDKNACKPFNGCKVITDGGVPHELSGLQGLFLQKVAGGHYTPLKKKFGTKSLLKPAYADASPGFVPAKDIPKEKVMPAEVPVSYDADGNAYNSDGKQLPDKFSLDRADVKCAKGNKKKQSANTSNPKKLKKCEKKCRKRFTQSKKHKSKGGIPAAKAECGPNPLGLSDYGPGNPTWTDGLKNTSIMRIPSRSYYYGMPIVGKFILNVLEHPVWSKAALNGGTLASGGGKTGLHWIIRDISPKWANGIDKTKGHVSHREGIGLDLSLPLDFKRSKKAKKLKYGFSTLYESPKRDRGYGVLDYDKCIVMGILTLQQKGMENSVIFVGVNNKTGSRFRPYIKKRCKELMTGDYDSNFIGPPDPAFEKILSVFQGPDAEGWVKKIVKLYPQYKNHQHHFHVRLGQRNATSFKRIMARLKKDGCGWTKPHPKSDPKWINYAKQFAEQGKLPPKRKPPKVEPQET